MAKYSLLNKNDIQILIVDQKMPEMTGLELLERVVKTHPDIIRIVLTGFAEIDLIVDIQIKEVK